MSSEHDPTPRIPGPVQETMRDLAERSSEFVKIVEGGGSWMAAYTWLLGMAPRVEALLDIGLDGIPPSSRVTLTPEQQARVASTFTVPDTVPDVVEDHTVEED